uniref:Uncharacterized protein n=1 Tax=Arundo donax TaxID=35708 RepID=A0A0A9CEM3_ARUDO
MLVFQLSVVSTAFSFMWGMRLSPSVLH